MNSLNNFTGDFLKVALTDGGFIFGGCKEALPSSLKVNEQRQKFWADGYPNDSSEYIKIIGLEVNKA